MTARVITISRQYGSGGRSIGEEVAKIFGYAFYDKVLIDLAAKKSGFAIDYIKNTEEQVTPNFLFNLAANGYYANTMLISDGLPASDNLFIMQSKIIREAAEQGPCVIVGRCADYILRERTDCLRVYLHAPLADRVQRAVTDYGLPAEGAESTVKRNDKIRGKHYQYYAGARWDDVSHYDLVINTSTFGCETTAQLIAEAARKLG